MPRFSTKDLIDADPLRVPVECQQHVPLPHWWEIVKLG
jgi:hypothetical protein